MTETATQTLNTTRKHPPKKSRTKLIWTVVVVVVVAYVALGTKVVSDDDPLTEGTVQFNAEEFGAEKFPEVQEAVIDNALEAPELASEISDDQSAAEEQHSEESSGGPVFSVTLTGTIGEGSSGIYEVDVDDVSDDLNIRVQTGPAINGTELRDATGLMSFGEFSNQIEFQNAAAALNDEMKDQVLSEVDTDDLEGETVTVTGAFTLINPEAWLVTPVELEVQ